MANPKNKNRLQIVNWREYGKDESRVNIALFDAADPGDLINEINTGPPIHGEELSFYVNDNIVIADGQIWDSPRGKYRIRIEKLPGGQKPTKPANPPSSLEFFIDPPATGPNAPEGGWLRIERHNPGKPKKIIRLSRTGIISLTAAIWDYWDKEKILYPLEKEDKTTNGQ